MIVGVCNLGVGADVHVELVGLSSFSSLGEDKSVGVIVMGLSHVKVEFLLAFESGHNVLVQSAGRSAVLDGLSLLGVTFDDGFTGLEGVHELIELNEVDAVVAQGNLVSLFIVLGAQENANNYVSSLVALSVDLVGEGLVVETILSGPDLEFVGVEFVFVNVQSVGELEIKTVEVGDEFVDLNIFYLNSGVVEVGVGIMGQVALVLQEVVDDALVELVECGVTKSGFEVFQRAGVDLVVMTAVAGVA